MNLIPHNMCLYILVLVSHIIPYMYLHILLVVSHIIPYMYLLTYFSAGQPYCSAKFLSLRTGDEVHHIPYTEPVTDIRANDRQVP